MTEGADCVAISEGRYLCPKGINDALGANSIVLPDEDLERVLSLGCLRHPRLIM